MKVDEDGYGDGRTEGKYAPGIGCAWRSRFEDLSIFNFIDWKLYSHLDEHWAQGSWETGHPSADGQISEQWHSETNDSRMCCVFSLICLLLVCALRVWVKGRRHRNLRISNSRVDWNVLPADIQKRLIATLPYERLHQLKVVSKPFRDCTQEDQFLALQRQYYSETLTFTAPHFFIRDGVLQCAGYDSSLQKWRCLPPLDYLPKCCTPDPDLFKEYLVCSHHGIICMNVSKSTEEKLIVFNPLTKQWKLLPSLNHRRNPVLMHILVNPEAQSFLLIAAGSSKSGDENLSRITELFDSSTWTWKRTGDFPGPDYALNEYQSGVYKEGYIFCVAFLDQDSGRGILRYNLSLGLWLKNWTYPLPFARVSTIVQLVENRGEVYVFSEQDNGEVGVEHCIDRLEWICHDHLSSAELNAEHVSELGEELGDELVVESLNLKNVVRSKKMGGRSLEIYPEYVCVGFSENELCVFNAIDHSGVLYDVQRFGEQKALDAPTGKGFGGEGFYTLNPLTFAIHPSFKMKL